MTLFALSLNFIVALNVISLADASGATMVTPLLNVGVAGVVLLWFMFKTEPRLKSMEEAAIRSNSLTQEALDRVARSNLLLVISSGLRPFQDQANAVIAELDEAKKNRQDQKPK